MYYTVSITSQGQISIPVQIRRKLGLGKISRAIVSEEKGEILITPVKDLLELKGSLHHKAIKNKSIDEIIEEEGRAIEKGFLDEYRKKLKRIAKG